MFIVLSTAGLLSKCLIIFSCEKNHGMNISNSIEATGTSEYTGKKKRGKQKGRETVRKMRKGN